MKAANEEIGSEVIGLEIKTTRVTARVLASAMQAFLEKKSNPHGKMSMKQLMGKDAALKSIEITDNNIKSFEHVARKYGVDFALKKDSTQEPPKYIVFFKARDAEVIEQAFKEYRKDILGKDKEKSTAKERPSVRERLRKLKEKLKDRNRQRERTRNRTRDSML